jgi:hypothetical protein
MPELRTNPLFEVDVRGFEPHSLRAKKGGHKAKVKRAFCDPEGGGDKAA